MLSWGPPQREWVGKCSHSPTTVSMIFMIVCRVDRVGFSFGGQGEPAPVQGGLWVRNGSQTHTSTCRWEKQIVFPSCFPHVLSSPYASSAQHHFRFTGWALSSLPQVSSPDIISCCLTLVSSPKSHWATLNSLKPPQACSNLALQPQHLVYSFSELLFPSLFLWLREFPFLPLVLA